MFPLVRPWRNQCAPTWLAWQGGLYPFGTPQARQRWRVRSKQVGLGEIQVCVPDLGSVRRRRQLAAVASQGAVSGSQAGRKQKAPAFRREDEEEEEEGEKARGWGNGRSQRRDTFEEKGEDEEEEEEEVVERRERGGRKAGWGRQTEVEVETEEEEDDDDKSTGKDFIAQSRSSPASARRDAQRSGGHATGKQAWSEEELQLMLNQAVLQVCHNPQYQHSTASPLNRLSPL